MDLFSEDARRSPHAAYDHFRRASPVLHLPGADLWLVFDYDGVKRALTDHETFSSRVRQAQGERLSRWLIFLDPPRHTRLRALVTRAFTPRVIVALEPRVRRLALELLDACMGRPSVDVIADFAVPLPLRVIAEMLGAPAEDWPRFRRWGDAMIALGYTFAGGAEAARMHANFAAASEEMAAYCASLLAARRASPADDLLTTLVEAEVDGERLSDADIFGFFQLLLVAGHETTTSLIGNAFLCFLEHPGELARVRAEPELLPSAIEEVLRFRSPISMMFRRTTREVHLVGVPIPAGATIGAMIGAANRDPSHFADASRFNVGRNPNPHVAFGHGIHFCIGAPLARMEARVALGEWLARVKTFVPTSDAPWTPRRAVNVHGPESLPLRIEA